MLFTNRAYTKHQDIHDQESFRKSGFLYSALQSPIQFCLVTASDIEISSLLNRNPLKDNFKPENYETLKHQMKEKRSLTSVAIDTL